MTAELAESVINKGVHPATETEKILSEFGWSCLNSDQQAALLGLVASKDLFNHASFGSFVTAETLIPDALNRSKNGRKAVDISEKILSTGLGFKSQINGEETFDFTNERQQAEKLLKNLRARAKENPSLLEGVGGVLETITEGDMGILFFPQGEDVETKKAVLDTWGILNDISSLLKDRPQTDITNLQDTIQNSGNQIIQYQQSVNNIRLANMLITTSFFTSYVLAGCTDDGPDINRLVNDAKATSSALVGEVVKEACYPNTVTDVNICDQMGGPENTGQPPDIQRAVENTMGQVSMGDPLDSRLPGAIREAIALYKQVERVGRILATTPGGEEVEVGLNFTDIGVEEQTKIINDLVQNAGEQGLTTELEIGPRNTLNPCPPDTLCFKIGLESPDKTDYKINKDHGSFMGFFKMDVNKLAENPELQGKFDRIYTVSPFPVTEEGNIISIRDISESAFELTNEGGSYTIWFNPYFNREFMDLRKAQEMGWPTTEDMMGQATDALWGQYTSIDYGPFSIMKERYPDLELPQSEFINPENQSAVNILIFRK